MSGQNDKLVPIRFGFGEGLLLLGEQNPKVVALTADLIESTRTHLFAEKFPERFFEMGVAEQNMAGVASGLAAMGKIPFMASYAVFSPGRNWEQIRTTICYNDRNVKIVSSHAGVSVGADGGSHQGLEDIAITRVLPNMIVISPCDALEARKATLAAAKYQGPVYIRLARHPSAIITSEKDPFEIGKADIIKTPRFGRKPEVGIIATGHLVAKAVEAASELEEEGVRTSVMNLATIKPLDRKAIISLAKDCGAVVTVEDHQIAGGMGSAVAELLAEEYPIPMEFVGVRDSFGQSGTPDELIEHYGLGVAGIKKAVKKVLSK